MKPPLFERLRAWLLFRVRALVALFRLFVLRERVYFVSLWFESLSPPLACGCGKRGMLVAMFRDWPWARRPACVSWTLQEDVRLCGIMTKPGALRLQMRVGSSAYFMAWVPEELAREFLDFNRPFLPAGTVVTVDLAP